MRGYWRHPCAGGGLRGLASLRERLASPPPASLSRSLLVREHVAGLALRPESLDVRLARRVEDVGTIGLRAARGEGWQHCRFQPMPPALASGIRVRGDAASRSLDAPGDIPTPGRDCSRATSFVAQGSVRRFHRAAVDLGGSR